MKKNVLLFLLAMIVAPAWAGDVAVAPSAKESAAQAASDNPLSITASPRTNALKAFIEAAV